MKSQKKKLDKIFSAKRHILKPLKIHGIVSDLHLPKTLSTRLNSEFLTVKQNFKGTYTIA